MVLWKYKEKQDQMQLPLTRKRQIKKKKKQEKKQCVKHFCTKTEGFKIYAYFWFTVILSMILAVALNLMCILRRFPMPHMIVNMLTLP